MKSGEGVMKLKAVLVLVLLSLALIVPEAETTPQTTDIDRFIEWTISSINIDNVIKHVRYFSTLESRYTGYSGSEEAAQYIYRYFEGLGLKPMILEYEVAIPLDLGSKIVILAPEHKELRAFALLPNHVQTCIGTYEGPLVYVGAGSLRELNELRQQLEGSIALMDFNSLDNWLNIMRLGAKAVIFIAPTGTIRSEADRKNLDVPIKFPRVYITREDGLYLLDLLRRYGSVNVRVEVNMRWEKVKAKNIVAILNGSDSDYWREAVAIAAYYDSSSIAPALAPGASEACGIAALLELARILTINPPRRSVWFLALSGHAQAMAGARNFVWWKKEGNFVWHYSLIGKNDNETKTPYTISYVIGLDFSTETDIVTVVSGGSFYGTYVWFNWYGYNDLYRWLFTSRRYGEYDSLTGVYRLGSEDLRRRLNLEYKVYAHGALPEGADLSVFIQAPMLYEASVISQVGIWGLTFTTALTARPLLGTPLDTFERLNPQNLRKQIEFSFIMIQMILNDVEWITYKRASLPSHIPGHTHMETGGLGFAVSVVRVGRWDMQRGWYDYNWTGILSERHRMLLHVKILERPELFGHEWFEISDNGTFVLRGLSPSVGWAVPVSKYRLLPFVIDAETGNIVYAPDFGMYGTRSWPFGFTFFPGEGDVIDGSGRKPVNLAVFRVGATIAIHDFIDPRSLLSPWMGGRIEVLDLSGITPRAYSYLISEPPSFEQARARRITLADPASGYEAVVLIPEGECVKLVLYSGASVIGVLTNREQGFCGLGGSYIDTAPTAMRVAEDLMFIIEGRVGRLREAGLMGAGAAALETAYQEAVTRLERARRAFNERRYGEYYTNILRSWYYAVLAYERSKGLIIDAGTVMVSFFVLAAPFTFLLERLIFHYEGRRRVLVLIILSTATFSALYILHPGFKVSPTSALTALGALILALVTPVFVMMFSDFASSLREIRAVMLGPSFAVGDRIALASVSLGVGVENLRRRKARTILTVISITLVTFAMLAFMALSPVWVTERRPPPGAPIEWSPRYVGVLVTRREEFAPINPLLIDMLRFEYGQRGRVVARAWIPLQNLWLFNTTGGSARIVGIIGLSRDESLALRLQEALADSLRPWFVLDEAYECYITRDLAERLSLKPGDDVYLYGLRLMVVGVVEPLILRSVYDINGQPMVPFDPLVAGPARERAYWGVIYIPYELALKLGGYPFSVAIITPDETEADKIASELSEYIGYYIHDVYSSTGKDSWLYLRREILFVAGWEFVSVPLIIGALLLFSVVMGNLYERTKDLYVYSTVGASPREAALIFIGEVITYAFLSAPLGYILALAFGPAAAGPLLNYASSAVIISLGASLASVLLSSVYPAYKAAKLITPSLERKWKPPTKPRGDRWEVPLPFVTRTVDEAKAMVVFVAELLKAYGSEAEPYIVTELNYRGVPTAQTFEAEMLVRLRPYEQGLTERVILRAERAARVARFNFMLLAQHVSGPRELWIPSHVRFVDEVRKRFLLWRSLEEEKRKQFIKRAGVIFQ
ncbi:MAG: FtsX-like permease family protein [Thermofilaceae archaeon]